MSADSLPSWSRVLVVIAHPDDESFGLGAVIDLLVRRGSEVHVLCLTAGEASTLGAEVADLGSVRAVELEVAAKALGVASATLRHYPDGRLTEHAASLVEEVGEAIAELGPDALLAFDADGGITGHPDHEAATIAARTAASRLDLPVLEWCLPDSVIDALEAELGVAFPRHPGRELPIVLTVDRERQHAAIAAHASQAVPGSVLWRRLELLGDQEHLRLA